MFGSATGAALGLHEGWTHCGAGPAAGRQEPIGGNLPGYVQPSLPVAAKDAEGTVRLRVGAVTHTVAASDVEPDHACHPDGFWASDPQRAAMQKRLPDAARYQDQISGHPGMNYYIPTGTNNQGNLPVQTYDGCITPQTPGAPTVTRPTLVDAKFGYGKFLQNAQKYGFLDTDDFTREADAQVGAAGGTPVTWFGSDKNVVPIFQAALQGTGADVRHEPPR